MADTPIVICNSALFKIGANTIMSLDDGTKEANACKFRYEECKKAVLRMHPWNSAIKRVTIASSTVTPAYGYTNQFALPGDFIRLVSVNPLIQADYKVESGFVLGNFTTLYLKYVYNTIDVSVLDDLLVEAIASYLAWDICFAITQNQALKKDLSEEKKQALIKAKVASSQEQPSPELEANYFLDARLGPVGSNTAQKINW